MTQIRRFGLNLTKFPSACCSSIIGKPLEIDSNDCAGSAAALHSINGFRFVFYCYYGHWVILSQSLLHCLTDRPWIHMPVLFYNALPHMQHLICNKFHYLLGFPVTLLSKTSRPCPAAGLLHSALGSVSSRPKFTISFLLTILLHPSCLVDKAEDLFALVSQVSPSCNGANKLKVERPLD